MPDWSVTVDGVIRAPVSDALLSDLAGALQPWQGAVSGHDRRVSATFSVRGVADARGAVETGMAIFDKVLAGCGLAPQTHLAVEAMTVEEADRRLAEPTVPELVGASEAADLLDVSRQRIHQLHTGHPGFPAPVVKVRMGPLWTKASVEAFGRSWSRKPGRPGGSAARPFEQRPAKLAGTEQG